MFEEAPFFPYDYVTTLIISLNPFVWRKVIDPRVDALRNKEKLDKDYET